MKQKSIEMVSSIVALNSLPNGTRKTQIFEDFFLQSNQLLLLVRIAKDLGNILKNTEYEKIILLIDECSRQGMGWKKSQE